MDQTLGLEVDYLAKTYIPTSMDAARYFKQQVKQLKEYLSRPDQKLELDEACEYLIKCYIDRRWLVEKRPKFIQKEWGR